MTMPQIVMLNHAAWVSSKRMDQRMEKKKTQGDAQKAADAKNPVVHKGKRLSELNSAELQSYYSDM